MTNPKSADSLIIDGPKLSRLALVLAHGAGAAMDSRFMNVIAAGVAERGYRTVRFEFPYMRARRETNRRRPPDREPVLLQSWRDMIEKLGGGGKLVIGGKSMGGRIASMVADEAQVRGLVCLGYPFHPPGKPAGDRIAHLRELRTPALIVQGERDSFGGRKEVAEYHLARSIRIAWIPDGDHSFKPPRASTHTEAGNLELAVSLLSEFLDALK